MTGQMQGDNPSHQYHMLRLLLLGRRCGRWWVFARFGALLEQFQPIEAAGVHRERPGQQGTIVVTYLAEFPTGDSSQNCAESEGRALFRGLQWKIRDCEEEYHLLP